jgi:two-component system cell cycle sensor histidine kinase/response regulator CckA
MTCAGVRQETSLLFLHSLQTPNLDAALAPRSASSNAGGILRRSGYHVIEARNAGEALLHSEEHPGAIHVLLSDVVMPQMSGPVLAKRLASVRPDMKVLCMSGYTDDSIVRHGVLDAHIAYFQKPITPEALTTRVREVLEGASSGRGG